MKLTKKPPVIYTQEAFCYGSRPSRGLEIKKNRSRLIRLETSSTFMRTLLISISFLLTAWGAMGQSMATELEKKAKVLSILRNDVLISDENKARIEANEEFILILEGIIADPGSFDLGFDSIQKMGVVSSPDGLLRIITWNLPLDEGTHNYHCYIQTRDRKQQNYKWHKLTDKSKSPVRRDERKTYSAENWYGALYYEIIPFRRGRKDSYTLLGWDGNNVLSTKKVIDVINLRKNKPPTFGAPIFKFGSNNTKRVVFEHSAEVTMSLHFDARKNQIVFNKLEPTRPELKGQYSFYYPSSTFQALELSKGKWVHIGEVDFRGGDNRIFNPPPGLQN